MTLNPEQYSTVQKITTTQWGSIVFAFLLVPLIFFGISRDLGWWQAWVYSIIIFLAGVGGRALAEQRHPGLLAERMRFGRKQDVKSWDRILAPLMGFTVIYPLVIVAGLDHYYGWTSSFPIWINVISFIVMAIGYAFGVWALIENRFFTMMVRIQFERGHIVCDTGPYRYIRHPGYAGHLLPLLSFPLALNSWWIFIPVFFAIVIIFLRTMLEDRTLIQELSGYNEYSLRVSYRLIPGIW